MEISGYVLHVLPEQTGTSVKGQWTKHSFVIETSGEYPKKIMFTMFGKGNTSLSFGEGDNVTVHFSVESREYNGKWYSDIKAYKVTTEGQRAQQNKPTPKGSAASSDDDLFGPTAPRIKQSQVTPLDDDTSDLPF